MKRFVVPALGLSTVLTVAPNLSGQPIPPKAAQSVPPASAAVVHVTPRAAPSTPPSLFARSVPPVPQREVLAALALRAPGDLDTPVTLDARAPWAPAIGGQVAGVGLAWDPAADAIGIHPARVVGPYADRPLGPGAVSCNPGLTTVSPDAICGSTIRYLPAEERSRLFVSFVTAPGRRYLLDCAFAPSPSNVSAHGPPDLVVANAAGTTRRPLKDVARVSFPIEGAPARSVTHGFFVDVPDSGNPARDAVARREHEVSFLGCTVYPSRPGAAAAPP